MIPEKEVDLDTFSSELTQDNVSNVEAFKLFEFVDAPVIAFR